MGRRRHARENALHALYLVDAAGVPADRAMDIACAPDMDEATANFARTLVQGALWRLKEVDKRIEEAAENWTLKRMAAVDRNLLRLAVYELLQTPDTPVKVIIDEALEIAKKFSTDESASFINGVLDRIGSSRGA